MWYWLDDGRRVVDFMRVAVMVCGHERVAASVSDFASVFRAVSVVMLSRLDVGGRVGVMRVNVSVCGCERVAASVYEKTLLRLNLV